MRRLAAEASRWANRRDIAATPVPRARMPRAQRPCSGVGCQKARAAGLPGGKAMGSFVRCSRCRVIGRARAIAACLVQALGPLGSEQRRALLYQGAADDALAEFVAGCLVCRGRRPPSRTATLSLAYAGIPSVDVSGCKALTIDIGQVRGAVAAKHRPMATSCAHCGSAWAACSRCCVGCGRAFCAGCQGRPWAGDTEVDPEAWGCSDCLQSRAARMVSGADHSAAGMAAAAAILERMAEAPAAYPSSTIGIAKL